MEEIALLPEMSSSREEAVEPVVRFAKASPAGSLPIRFAGAAPVSAADDPA